MRPSILLLLATASLTFGQVSEPECLDIDRQFVLFHPQFRNTSKVRAIPDFSKYLKDSIYLRIDFGSDVRYDHDIKGIAVELVNTTSKNFTIDNAFQEFFCQVKHEGGWLTIERNEGVGLKDDISLGLVVPTNSYVTAILPCYKGTEKVTMRYRFAIGDRVMYSQEFAGTINPRVLD